MINSNSLILGEVVKCSCVYVSNKGLAQSLEREYVLHSSFTACSVICIYNVITCAKVCHQVAKSLWFNSRRRSQRPEFIIEKFAYNYTFKELLNN